MRLKNSLILTFIFISGLAQALTEIPSGKHELEGKISVEKESTYFTINFGSLSQTKIRLQGDTSLLKDQHYSNARLEVEFKHNILSSQAEAKFLRVVRFLGPAEDPKIYSEEKDF